MVAKGFPQVEGIDFTETFAPTVMYTTLRALFSTHLGLHLEQTDVDCAFMYAIMKEEIHMEQPQGFEVTGSDGEKLVCNLLNAVYGLKQAPHSWHKLLHDFRTTQYNIRNREQLHDSCCYITLQYDTGCYSTNSYILDE